MRAMSLVSSDSEGEQNELRNLQEKLESTMKLVTNLSGQLSELKDQVKKRTLPAYTHTHTTTIHTRFGEGGKKTVVLMLQYWSLSSERKRKWVRSPFGPSVSPPFPPHCPFDRISLWHYFQCCSGRGFNVTNKTRKWENANYFSEVLSRKTHCKTVPSSSLTEDGKLFLAFLFSPQNYQLLSPGTCIQRPGDKP